MNKIQFRGKTKDGKWVYGYLQKEDIIDGITIIPETVGQYIGVDCCGISIYENDIVKCGSRYYKVVYSDTYNNFVLKDEDDVICHMLLNLEVIGNDYEYKGE